MASESKRGCGYRKVGGMYLVGGLLSLPCDRLPYPLTVCPVCGQGMKVNRGFTRINPLKVFGLHDEQVPVFQDNPAVAGEITKVNCFDAVRPCLMCDPTEEPSYIMLVGEKYYTTKSFIEEADTLGVSKRIPFIPQEFEVGKTVIYLAHKKACIENGIGEANKKGRIKMLQETTGIFCVFIPQKVEKLFWESELKGKKGEALKKKLAKKGITPVAILDGDKDHK